MSGRDICNSEEEKWTLISWGGPNVMTYRVEIEPVVDSTDSDSDHTWQSHFECPVCGDKHAHGQNKMPGEPGFVCLKCNAFFVLSVVDIAKTTEYSWTCTCVFLELVHEYCRVYDCRTTRRYTMRHPNSPSPLSFVYVWNACDSHKWTWRKTDGTTIETHSD